MTKGNFKELYKLPTIKNIYEPLGIDLVPIKVAHDNSLLGVEVEVENIRSAIKLPGKDGSVGWDRVEDGSLRNFGAEFVSAPTRSSDIQEQLVCLFNALPKDRSFSPRTSIHVHLNMRMYNKEKLFCLVLAYLATEKLLFNWVGHNRAKNIHCVPLQETDNVGWLSDFFTGKKHSISWDKYSALNFIPLKEKKGTIEFRHMYGTDDLPAVMQWINFILSLKVFSYFNKSKDIIQLFSTINTSSLFGNLLEKIYGEHAKALIEKTPTWMKDMEQGVSLAKRLILYRDKIMEITSNIKNDSPIWLCFPKKKNMLFDGYFDVPPPPPLETCVVYSPVQKRFIDCTIQIPKVGASEFSDWFVKQTHIVQSVLIYAGISPDKLRGRPLLWKHNKIYGEPQILQYKRNDTQEWVDYPFGNMYLHGNYSYQQWEVDYAKSVKLVQQKFFDMGLAPSHLYGQPKTETGVEYRSMFLFKGKLVPIDTTMYNKEYD